MEEVGCVGVDGSLETFLGVVFGAEVADTFCSGAVFCETVDEAFADLGGFLNLRVGRRRFIQVDFAVLVLLGLECEEGTVEGRHELSNSTFELA